MKGIVYYTDNQLKLKIGVRVQRQLAKIGLPIVSASYKPMDFGKNVQVPIKEGALSTFKRILAALENSDADIVYFCEANVLYHPSHFDFTPPKKKVWYYNENVWKLDARSGHALHYDCRQVSGIAVWRKTAIKHYQKRVAMVEKNGFSSGMGYEPGTHHRRERVDDSVSVGWKSDFPNIEIRYDSNFSPNRWKKEEFRNQEDTKGWVESDDEIPGWGKTKVWVEKFN